MNLDLEDLKRKAEAAMPGEREYGVRNDGSIWLSIGSPLKGPHYQGDIVATAADADLICAASPSVVLELIAKIERLQVRVEESYQAKKEWQSRANDMFGEIKQLHARIAELEKE